MLIFPAHTQIESQFPGCPPVVVHIEGILSGANRLGRDEADATAGRLAQQQSRQTLPHSAWRTGGIVQRSAGIGGSKSECSGSAAQGADIDPSLSNVESDLQIVSPLLLVQARKDIVHVIVADVDAFPAQAGKARDREYRKSDSGALQLFYGLLREAKRRHVETFDT